jgi:hypothetical protein
MESVLVLGAGRYGTPHAFKSRSPGVRSREAERLGPDSRRVTVPSRWVWLRIRKQASPDTKVR